MMIVDETTDESPREPRRDTERPTWMSLDDGITKIECFVLDVSPNGAKIVTDAAIDIRDSFVLALVPQHPKRQSLRSRLAPGPDLRRKIPALIGVNRATAPGGFHHGQAPKPLRRIVA